LISFLNTSINPRGADLVFGPDSSIAPCNLHLQPARELQRKAQWRVDFVNAKNSMGFHAPQETARVLGEAVDMARQGQIAVLNAANK
jgi:formate-dependent nitrite reductase cytochrome c552 subunit